MRLSEIDPSLRPENASPKEVLQSFHRALKYRYYYMAFPLIATALLPLILRVTKLISRQVSEENAARVAIPLVLLIVYINAVEMAISLFSFGTQNSFDPLRNLIVFDARIALNVLKQKAPRIYDNNIYKMIAESPEYTSPNLKIETNIQAIDQEYPYTPLKLAKELGAINITDMFDRISDEEKIIFLLLRSFVNMDGNLTQLNSDAVVHILSFFAGSKISELKSKAPDTELQAFTAFSSTHAKKTKRQPAKIFGIL